MNLGVSPSFWDHCVVFIFQTYKKCHILNFPKHLKWLVILLAVRTRKIGLDVIQSSLTIDASLNTLGH